LEWKFGNILEGGGTSFLNLSDLVGVGSKVSFWHDIWCENRPLKISYLDLCSIPREEILPRENMCGWRIICSFKIRLFNEM
jgi:hypothetical protein